MPFDWPFSKSKESIESTFTLSVASIFQNDK